MIDLSHLVEKQPFFMDALGWPSACSARFRLQKAEQAFGRPSESNNPLKFQKNRVERPLVWANSPKALI